MRLSVQRKARRASLERVGVLLAAVGGLLLVTAGIASTTTYEYDVHGRLKKITREDGSVVIYTWDNTTNRTQTASYTTPGVPPSISVPSSSTTGSYTVSWGAASGTLSAYELYEATNSGFSGQVLAYSGGSTNWPDLSPLDATYTDLDRSNSIGLT